MNNNFVDEILEMIEDEEFNDEDVSKMIILIEQHRIKKAKKTFKECDDCYNKINLTIKDLLEENTKLIKTVKQLKEQIEAQYQ